MNQHPSNGYGLTIRYAVCALALGVSACTGSVGGPGAAGDDPGTSGAAGTGAGGGSGASGKGGGSGASGAATGGGGGVAGSSGTGGSIGGGPNGYNIALDGAPIHSHYVRLTHQQWENSVRDLLKLAAVPGLSSMFTSDPPNGTFSNNELRLFVTSGLRGDYERAAETLARQVATNAQARTAIGATGNAATFIRTFGRRVYRRPLEATEQQRYEALHASAATLYTSGDAFANGVELVIRAMLQSPNFVYRTELGADAAPLSNFEIASKLSFLLRDTTPDDALLDAAERGELGTTDAVLQRAQAILDDGMEAVPVLARYHSELFGLDRFETIDKDRTLFPNYNPTMNPALMEADRMFFERVFQNGLGVREVLLSSVAFVNASTAPFYAATASGSGLTQVTVGPERPGFFTRIGFLAYNGNLREPDPIHRGVDIMHRLLCSTLAPPPGEIPPLPAVMPGQTNRQRVEAHTGDGVCGGCHATLINPLGFALENFDALGQLRTMDNGQTVNTGASYELSSGITPFSGAPELMQILAGAPETHACYARRLGEYSLARDMAEADRGLVNELTTASLTDTGSLKAMLLAAVRSPLFTVRTGGTP